MAALPSPTEGVTLTRSSVGTLHHQLYSTLLEMIERGDVKPGERTPTEAELVETYGISRTTARRALDELRRQGIVERRPGMGTFVLPPKLDAAIPHLHSITEEIEQLGYEPGIVLASVDHDIADPQMAEQLAVDEGSDVLVVTRIHTADGRPVSVSRSTLNITEFPELAEKDFAARGLHPMLESAMGTRINRSIQWLSAVPADKDVAEALEMDAGAPVLRAERVFYLEDNRPFKVVVAHFHGRAYKHYSESYRPLD